MDDATRYTNDLHAMDEALRNWVKSHPFATLAFRTVEFEEELARQAGQPGKTIAVIAPLVDVIEQWATNTDTKELLRTVASATENRATYLMTKAMLEFYYAKLHDATTSVLPPDGDWGCIKCKVPLNRSTPSTGEDVKPEAGSICLCLYCGELQQIDKSLRRYVPVSTKEFNQLAKSSRVQLTKMRSMILANIEKEKSRS